MKGGTAHQTIGAARQLKILDAIYVPVCASLLPRANFQPNKNSRG